MFFRREKPREMRFEDRIGNLKNFGFNTQSAGSGRVKAMRGSIAAIITDVPGGPPHVDRAGLIMGDEIGLLVNGGYQMFFATASGKRRPALADQLKQLHAFEEDLREGLGLISLYNLSLGTISDKHMYDRVQGREPSSGPRPAAH